MPPTFAPDYTEPGTYTQVILEPTPVALTPAFVTAFIGRTASDKPATTEILRNEVDGIFFEIDQLTRAIKVGVNDIGGSAVVEPPRMDLLKVVLVQGDISSIDTITDELGLTHLKGEENSWITFFNDGTGSTIIGHLIEWITKFRFTRSIGSTHPPIENIAGSSAIIELARASRDTKFTFGDTVFPTGVTPGFFGGFISAAPAKYVLHVTADNTVTPETFTFTLTDTDSGGNPISAVHTTDNSLAVNIGASPVTDGAGVLIPALGGTNLRKQGDATATDTWDLVTAGGILEFDLTSETGALLKFRVNITQLVTHFTGASFTDFLDAITVSVAGPSFGTGGGLGIVPPVGTAGTKYTVSYRTIKTVADLVPKTFDNLTAIQLEHGVINENTLNDSLSFGSLLYFNQGGGSLVLLALRDNVIDPTDGFDLSIDTEYEAAISEALVKLEDVAEVSLVIPLTPTEPTGVSVSPGTFRPQVFNSVKAHVLNMSTLLNDQPRMAIMGARANITNEEVFIAGAEAGLEKRVVYLSPATATISAGGKTFLADGSSLAAAMAGILSNPAFNAGEPVAGKQLTAFADVPDPHTRKQKNRIAKAGVTVIEQALGGPTVRDFLTTDPRTILSSDAKVSKIAIDIRRTLKTALNNTMINIRLINGETISQAAALVSMVLQEKVNNQIINAFEIIDIKINESEPSQLDIDVSIRPTQDLKWIRFTATFTTAS